MKLKTRIYELGDQRYKSLSELARAMGISVSHIYRVREGQRHINQKFIVGAIKAFPDHRLDDLFYLSPSRPQIASHILPPDFTRLSQEIAKASEAGARYSFAPSILSADFSRLSEEIVEASNAGADYIHVDVMDGHFVPQITIGAPVVAAIRPWTSLPLDVHLMIEAPEHQINQFADAGADIITVQIEACPHIRQVVQIIKESEVKAGVALNPETPIEMLKEILPSLDLVLVMTVNPGFGGQVFIEEMLNKIAHLRAELDRKGLAVELEVDGGINAEVAPRVVRAGARVLVAGAAVFNSEQSIKEALAKIRASFD